jgi:hypothetical protein
MSMNVKKENFVEYTAWLSMKSRCYNPKNASYKLYGGRGVTVCDEWRGSFRAFLEHLGPRPDGMSLDRIDSNGNYEPGNVRWADWRTQSRNKKNNHMITYDGRTMCVTDWAKESPVSQSCISSRIFAGWTPEEAITTPNQNEKGLKMRRLKDGKLTRRPTEGR